MNVNENTMLISVIIPVYNAENTICAALESVSNQTKGRFEIIVVNDGSTDNSAAEIYAFKKAHTELLITIIDKPHEGVSATRNKGLRIATGNYIAFLDADDEWHPDKTIKQLAVLNETSDVDVVGCLYKPLVQRRSLKKVAALKPVASKDMLFKNIFQTSTIIMKRKVFEINGYFERSISYGEERRYFLQASKTCSCMLMNENLINYGNGKRAFGESGLSANLFQMEIDELKNLVYAYRVLGLPLFACCNAIAFSLIKFVRRLSIVYITDRFKHAAYEKK